MNIKKKKLSPFNIKEGSISMEFFTKVEAQELMHEFCSEYNVVVTDEVKEALYNYTNGYERETLAF